MAARSVEVRTTVFGWAALAAVRAELVVKYAGGRISSAAMAPFGADGAESAYEGGSVSVRVSITGIVLDVDDGCHAGGSVASIGMPNSNKAGLGSCETCSKSGSSSFRGWVAAEFENGIIHSHGLFGCWYIGQLIGVRRV